MQPIDFCALNAKSNRSTVFVNDTGNIINDYVDKMIARISLLVRPTFGTPSANKFHVFRSRSVHSITVMELFILLQLLLCYVGTS